MPLISRSAFEDLRQMYGDGLLDTLIDVFLEEGPKLLAAMQVAHASADIEAFRRHAHSLKSNAETVGADGLAALARELELAARAGTPGSPAQLTALREAYDAVADELPGLREHRP